ncbi:hypothetical protein J6590_104740, partial [Homalodisca vitripennis]
EPFSHSKTPLGVGIRCVETRLLYHLYFGLRPHWISSGRYSSQITVVYPVR